MNNREQQRKFSEQSTINNSTFDAMNTSQTQYSYGQEKNVRPADRNQSRLSSYSFWTGIIYITGVLIAIMSFIFIVPMFKYIVSSTFYNGSVFLLCSLLFCVTIACLWINIGLKLVKK